MCFRRNRTGYWFLYFSCPFDRARQRDPSASLLRRMKCAHERDIRYWKSPALLTRARCSLTFEYWTNRSSGAFTVALTLSQHVRILASTAAGFDATVRWSSSLRRSELQLRHRTTVRHAYLLALSDEGCADSIAACAYLAPTAAGFRCFRPSVFRALGGRSFSSDTKRPCGTLTVALTLSQHVRVLHSSRCTTRPRSTVESPAVFAASVHGITRHTMPSNFRANSLKTKETCPN
jgi:hypothetical protein